MNMQTNTIGSKIGQVQDITDRRGYEPEHLRALDFIKEARQALAECELTTDDSEAANDHRRRWGDFEKVLDIVWHALAGNVASSFEAEVNSPSFQFSWNERSATVVNASKAFSKILDEMMAEEPTKSVEVIDAKAIVDTAFHRAWVTYLANNAAHGTVPAPGMRFITTVCSSVADPIIGELLRRGIGSISERSSWADEHSFEPKAIFSEKQLQTEAEVKGCEAFVAHLVQAGCECECVSYYD